MITVLTEEEFLTLFPGKHELWELLNTQPKSEQELLFKYLPSKLWRLNNLYTITDKDGDVIPFKMNRAQFIVHANRFIHPRLIILKSRQQGISTYYLIDYFDDTITLSNLKCGLMAQDRDASGSLLERVKFTWDNLDDYFKNFLNIKKLTDNSSEFTFSNGSKMIIKTSFRSATLQRLHISELGSVANNYPKKAKETKTGTLQTIKAGNPIAIESTAEGANMFKDFWDTAYKLKVQGLLETSEQFTEFSRLWSMAHMHANNVPFAGKDFYPVFLSWLFDPDCQEHQDQYISSEHANYFSKVEAETGLKLTDKQKNFWIVQERELEGDIHQEYPATPEEAFAAAKDGTYWARKYIECIIRKNHKVKNLYDPKLPVYVAMDLGRNDYNVLIFFQYWEESDGKKSIRIIHEYYNSGEGLDHYARYLKAESEFDDSPTKKYDIEVTALPHDATVTDLSTRGNRTREDILNEEGITNTFVLDKWGKQTGIELVRQYMNSVWIDESCSYTEQCFLNYTKEWNPVLNIWKNEPKRNEWAHGADAIRYVVQYVDQYLTGSVTTNNRYDPIKPRGGISL